MSKFKVIVLSSLIAFSGIFIFQNVYGTDGTSSHSGNSADGGGGANCNSDGTSAITTLCPNNGGGGMSWHFYKTDGDKHPIDGRELGNIMKGDITYDSKSGRREDTIKYNCGAEKGYDSYVSFGWDAVVGKNWESGDQIGPINFLPWPMYEIGDPPDTQVAYNNQLDPYDSAEKLAQDGYRTNSQLTIKATAELWCKGNDTKESRFCKSKYQQVFQNSDYYESNYRKSGPYYSELKLFKQALKKYHKDKMGSDNNVGYFCYKTSPTHITYTPTVTVDGGQDNPNPNDADEDEKNKLKIVYTGETAPARVVVNIGAPKDDSGKVAEDPQTGKEYKSENLEGKVLLFSFASDRNRTDAARKNQSITDEDDKKKVDLWIKVGNYICDKEFKDHIGNYCGIINATTASDGPIDGPIDNVPLNSDNKDTGKTFFDTNYDVYDVGAGNYYCVVGALQSTEYTSNYQTDSAPEGNGNWYISAPYCRLIAKKPSFQVWGAGVFSADTIDTLTAAKHHVAGDEKQSWEAELNDSATWIGSWDELSVTMMGDNKDTMASGAATAYRDSSKNLSSPWTDILIGANNGSFGGLNTSSNALCKRSPLTIANTSCESNSVGGFSNGNENNALQNYLVNNREDIFDKLFSSDLASKFPGNTYRTTECENKDTCNINDSLDKEWKSGTKTLVIKADSKASEISRDINLRNLNGTEGFKTLADIPKIVILAEGDIKINCDVTRIDAILVAKGKVNTCAEFDTTGGSLVAKVNKSSHYGETLKTIIDEANNDASRSKQLVINGAVIANSVVLPRSYGAGIGANSMVSAEIINYDSSIYLWAYHLTEVANAGLFTEASRTEVAPRY